MRKILVPVTLTFITLACGMLLQQDTASATARIDIDLSAQSMHVEADAGSYDFPISSARAGYSTPRGYYRPQRLVRMHYSKKYHNSPMPHSIFFRGGYAIHGTGAISQLGKPASHGCIRLSRANAALLYEMVQEEGGRISISGSPPGGTIVAKSEQAHTRVHVAAARHRHIARATVYPPQAVPNAPRYAPRALAYTPQYAPVAARPLRFWLFNPGRR